MMSINFEKLLAPCAIWYDIDGEEGEKKNQKAKEILLVFYKELLKVKPEKKYDAGRFHLSYLFQLIPIRKAFEEQRYMRVCNELLSLLHFEPITQPRIYYNVLRMLKHYLDIGGE